MFGILEGVLNSLHDQKLIPLRKEILTGQRGLIESREHRLKGHHQFELALTHSKTQQKNNNNTTAILMTRKPVK